MEDVILTLRFEVKISFAKNFLDAARMKCWKT